MRRNFINLKIGAILFLILIFYIGLFFISNLVDERQSYQQQVIRDIAKEQIRPQQVIAPYLKLPYQLSSCYIGSSPDNIEGIFDGYKEMSLLSKFGGGIGWDWNSIRSLGGIVTGKRSEEHTSNSSHSGESRMPSSA